MRPGAAWQELLAAGTEADIRSDEVIWPTGSHLAPVLVFSCCSQVGQRSKRKPVERVIARLPALAVSTRLQALLSYDMLDLSTSAKDSSRVLLFCHRSGRVRQALCRASLSPALQRNLIAQFILMALAPPNQLQARQEPSGSSLLHLYLTGGVYTVCQFVGPQQLIADLRGAKQLQNPRRSCTATQQAPARHILAVAPSVIFPQEMLQLIYGHQKMHLQP